MITPTDRSMPAVRTTSVWRSGQDADDGDLLQDQRQRVRPRRSARPAAMPKTTIDEQISTISGTSGRVGMQEVLQPLERRSCRSSNCGDGLVALLSRTFSNSCGWLMLSPVPMRRPRWPCWRVPVRLDERAAAKAALAAGSRRSRGSRPCCRRGSAPAQLRALGGVDRLTPAAGLSVTSATPVSKKALPSVGAGFVAVLGALRDRLDAERAISSGYCCEVAPMTPSLTDCDARAAAVDRHDQHVVFLADGLQRLDRRRRRRVR